MLPTPLGHLYIMHQHIDNALISAFVERWQPDTKTFHMPWGEMTIMLYDVQTHSWDGDWKLALASLFGELASELRRKRLFTNRSINVSEIITMTKHV